MRQSSENLLAISCLTGSEGFPPPYPCPHPYFTPLASSTQDLQLTEVACDVHGRLAVDDAAGRKASDAAVREKPVVSAATQEASAKRSSELLARLCDDFEVIPQRRGTRLSYHLAEGTGGESCGIQGPNASGSQIVKADGIEPILKPSDGEDTKTGEEKERRAGPSETPCWRAAAERVETARELCVGDVVRVRCEEH